MEFLLALSPLGAFTLWVGALVSGPWIKKKAVLAYHKWTKGEKAPDRLQMEMILHSLREFPNEWKISERMAAFPKTGSARIAVNTEAGKPMHVSIDGDSTGGNFFPVSPFYEYQIGTAMKDILREQRERIAERELFPNGLPLMLTDGSKR